jgi:hypothetical protein
MRTVWKYELSHGLNKIDLPAGAQPVHAAMQGNALMLWVDQETEFATQQRAFIATGTGHTVPAGAVFIATAFGGPFVWHIWEIR